jgi:uncharacterized membrane protein
VRRVFVFARRSKILQCVRIQMAFALSKHFAARVLAGGAAAVAVAAAVPAWDFENLDVALIALAVVASLAAACRQLPLQNVLMAAGFAALIGGVAHGLSANPNLAMPFGQLTFNPNAGAKIFGAVPWTIPLLWIFAILNSRGVARLMLRPWRKQKNYGFILIGVTAVLATVFDLALEPFAAHVKHFWLWQPTKFPWSWHGASPVNFFGWFFVAILILAFATPSLIKKAPGSSGGTELISAALWFGAVTLFAVGAAAAGFWPAVAVDAVLVAVTAVCCWRGANW